MKITNSFPVQAPVDRAWAVLTDLELVAPCMPGASLTGRDGDDYLGRIKVKVGPVTSEFKGAARFVELDETAHRGVMTAKARDVRGAGNAEATVIASLTDKGDHCVVDVETDMQIVGKLAQFGAGMIQQISEKLLGEFARRLEVVLESNPDVGAGDARPAATASVATGPDGTVPDTAAASTTAAAEKAAGDTASAPRDEDRPEERLPDTPAPAPEPTVATADITPAADDDAGGLPAGFVYTPPEPGKPYAYELSARSAGRTRVAGQTEFSPLQPEPEPVPAVQEVEAAPQTASAPAGGEAARKVVTFDDDGDTLDLMEFAGGTVAKRLIPVGVAALVVGAVVAFLVSVRGRGH